MMDKKINCTNCGNIFVWSIQEQELFKKRGLEAPEYCPICRGMMEARKGDRRREQYERQ